MTTNRVGRGHRAVIAPDVSSRRRRSIGGRGGIRHRARGRRPGHRWSSLASSIGGSVLLPGNGAQFSSGKQVFNSLYDGSNPAAVVTVTSQADVQKAVAFATANKLKIAPDEAAGILHRRVERRRHPALDLRPLPGGVNFDSGSGNVTVPAVTELYAVHKALAGAGRAIPTGTCPTVGVAGLASAAALGADSLHAGLTCDALRSARVVLPSGDVVTTSANDNPDLFWGRFAAAVAATSG